MASDIEKFEIRDNSTWEHANGRVFVSVSDVPSKGPITVTVGAIGCDNVRKEMIVGDVIQFDAGSHGRFEVRLQSIYEGGGEGRVSFYIAKIS